MKNIILLRAVVGRPHCIHLLQFHQSITIFQMSMGNKNWVVLEIRNIMFRRETTFSWSHRKVSKFGVWEIRILLPFDYVFIMHDEKCLSAHEPQQITHRWCLLFRHTGWRAWTSAAYDRKNLQATTYVTNQACWVHSTPSRS